MLAITFCRLLSVAPFNVRVPDVVELSPIIKARVRKVETSTAPIDKLAVPKLIPAVVAVPVLLNCATLLVVHAPEAVLGVQFVFVYHAVPVVEFVQGIRPLLEVGTTSPVERIVAPAAYPVKVILANCPAVRPVASLPTKILLPVPAIPGIPDQLLMVIAVAFQV